MKCIIDIWKSVYPEIDNQAAIMATLYNMGEYGGEKDSVCITNIKQAVGIVMSKHEELASYDDADDEIAASIDDEMSNELTYSSEDEYDSWD